MHPKRPLVSGTCAVFIGALAVVLCTSGSVPWQRNPILARLAIAGGYRAVEPRLSVDVPYAPFHPARRSLDRRAQMSSLTGTPYRGLAQLLGGDTASALDTLRRADKANAIDLAAAHYMHGLQTGSLADFGRALDALSSAPPSAAATFNRALILEQLSDAEAAGAEWKKYLALDNSSAWASEARQHLATNRQPATPQRWAADKPRLIAAAEAGDTKQIRELVTRYPLGTRQLVQFELLPAWAKSSLRGDKPTAERTLTAARSCASTLQDRLLHDVVVEIDGAVDPSKLAKAYTVLAEAHQALEAADHDRVLALNADVLRLAGDRAAFAALVVDDTVTARYRKFDSVGAQALIDGARVRYANHRRDYAALFARLDWLEGSIQFLRGDISGSMRTQARALAAYEMLGEAEFIAAQHVNLASSLVYLGEYERAAVHLRSAMAFGSRAEDPRRLYGAVKVAADWAVETDQRAAALAFQDRFVRIARATGEPVRIADALVNRGLILVRVGRHEEALRDAAEVERLADRITDPATRKRLQIDARTTEAFALRDTDSRAQIASLTRAVDLMRELELPMKLAQLLLERGRAHLRVGANAAAETDFRAGIAELEHQRRLIRDAELRVTYFDRADRLFVDLAQLLLRRGQPEEAFDLLERLRSRELLDRSSGQPMAPMHVNRIRAQLPRNTILVSHTIARESLITCVVTRDGVRVFEQRASESAIVSLLEVIRDGFSAARLPQPELRRLSALLIGNIPLVPESRIVFIPDSSLSDTPFAALRTPNDRYLVENHTIVVSPSATLYVHNTARDRLLGARGEPSLLALASPQPPRDFDDLPALTRAAAEVRLIARGYARHRVVVADAEHVSLLTTARDFQVVHLASHSVVDYRTPARSALLIGERGRITAAEIEAAALPNVRLVILGGCNTGIGKLHRSEGAMSLARAFMAATVPAVLGTIAPVEDEAAERLLTRFHEFYRQGTDAATALRRAQLQRLQSGNDPAHWAAFEVIGGASAPETAKEET